MAEKNPIAPPPGVEKNIHYPRIPRHTFSNGLEIFTIQDQHLPQVSVTLGFPAGRILNPEGNSALVPLSVELLRSGTSTRSSTEIAALMDRCAMIFESSTSMEHSFVSMSFLKDQMETALGLLAEFLFDATFPESELERVRTLWRSELKAQRSQPGFLANESIFRDLYRNHPYSCISIQPSHLEASTADQVRKTFRRSYGPRGAFLVVAGAVDPDLAVRLSQRFLEGWEETAVPSVPFPKRPEITTRRINLIHRPHSVQSHVLVGGQTLPRAHPEMVPLTVTNQVLGGGASARLFLNLREEKGYTYGAYSQLRSYRQDGLFLAGASVKSDVTAESIQEIFSELDSLKSRPPDQEELSRTQQEIIGSFIRRMETPASIALLELERRLYELPQDYYENLIPEVRRVSRRMVSEMAERCFSSKRLVAAVVADREAVEKDLEKMGELKVYDIEGNPL